MTTLATVSITLRAADLVLLVCMVPKENSLEHQFAANEMVHDAVVCMKTWLVSSSPNTPQHRRKLQQWESLRQHIVFEMDRPESQQFSRTRFQATAGPMVDLRVQKLMAIVI
jgi:hypothetical protein